MRHTATIRCLPRFFRWLLPISLLAAGSLLVGGWCPADEPPGGKRAERPGAFEFKFDFRELPFDQPADLARNFGIPSVDDFFGGLDEQQRAALRKIPVSEREEREWGNRAVESHLGMLRAKGIDLATRGREFDYLERLVKQVQPRMENRRRYPRIRLYLADTKEIDARSFPGGTLIFTRGMLDFAGSEAALVGVVGHELSHLDHGHQLLYLRRLKYAQQTMAGGQPGFAPQQFLENGMLMMKMFSRPFQPEDEAEADADGARWAYLEGYDPRAMAELFRQRQPADGPQLGFLNFFRSHPPDRERFQAIMRQFQELQRDQPRRELYLGRTNLLQRVTRNQRRFPE